MKNISELQRIFTPILASLIGFLIVVSASTAQAAWYMETKYSCSDPYKLANFFGNSQWFEKVLPLIFVSVNQGYVYAEISKLDLASNSYLLEEYHIFESVTLSAEKAKNLTRAVRNSVSDADVPLFVKKLPSLSEFFVKLSSASSLVIDGLFSYMFLDVINTLKIKRISLVPLLASGGTVEHLVTLGHQNNRYFLLSAFIYKVNVGKESRVVWLSSCTHPAKIEIRAFRTILGVNDKIVRMVDHKWYVENEKSGDRDPGYLVKIDEDDIYYYFKQVNFSSFYERYRISKFGGPFQVLDEQTWITLYPKTEAM